MSIEDVLKAVEALPHPPFTSHRTVAYTAGRDWAIREIRSLLAQHPEALGGAARLEWRPKGFVPPIDDESYWWVMWDDGSIEPVEARHAARHHYPDRLRWAGPIPLPEPPKGEA